MDEATLFSKICTKLLTLFFLFFLLVEKERQRFYSLAFDSVLLDKKQKLSYLYVFCDLAESWGKLEKYRKLQSGKYRRK